MEEKEIQILEKIVEYDGDCLLLNMCSDCPFKARCLSDFLKEKVCRPTREERLNLALDAITNITLLGDNDITYSRD